MCSRTLLISLDFQAGLMAGCILVRSALICMPMFLGSPPSMPFLTPFKLLAVLEDHLGRQLFLHAACPELPGLLLPPWKPLSCSAFWGSLLIWPWVHYLRI